MKKNFITNITSLFHKRSGHEAWNDTNYCLVKEYKQYDIPHSLGAEPFYACSEFKTKKEALDYIDRHVSKANRKYCHLYKKLKTFK